MSFEIQFPTVYGERRHNKTPISLPGKNYDNIDVTIFPSIFYFGLIVFGISRFNLQPVIIGAI